jgi:hypothetical protein
MNYNKIRRACRYIRITVGLALIILAFITNNNWLYLGIIPLIAGIINFCPLCIITKKCTT